MAVLSTLSAPLIPLLHLLHAFLLLAPAAALALPRSTQFITPDDETNNVCLQPASWNQVLSFFLTNYIARIATFKKTSGYEGFRDYVSTFASLFVPFVGISEAAATISRGSRWLGKDDVERALLAKALCVIVREPGWRPENEEIIRGCIIGKGDEAERRREQKRRRRKKKKERRKKGRSRSRSRMKGENRKSRRQDRIVELDPAYMGRDEYEMEEYADSFDTRRSHHPHLDIEPSLDDERSRRSKRSSRHSRRHAGSDSVYEPRRSRNSHLNVESIDDRSSGRRPKRRSRDPSIDPELYSPVPAASEDLGSRGNRYGLTPDLYDTPPPVPAHLDDDHAHHAHNDDYLWDISSSDFSTDSEDSFSSCTATLVMADPGIDVLDNPKKWKIQGYYSLPPMYTIAHLPPGTTLRPLSTSSAKKEEVTISNSYGVVKSFTGAIQIISSLYTLYTAYGDETDRYGYAAFGFSVLPYTIMSFMNTIANLVEATYDTLYLVRSDVMLEAERREHGEFIGEVAELVPASKATELEVAGMTTVDLRFLRRPKGKWVAVEVDDAGKPIDGGVRYKVNFPHDTAAYNPAKDPRDKILVQPVGQSYRFNYVKHKRAGKFQRAAIWVITLLSLVIPYIVIGALSKFNRGTESTLKQRVFMMGWLVSGQTIGVFDLVGQGTKIQRRWPKWAMVENFVDKSIVVVGFALAVGGFVQVGTMLRDFGYCVKV